MTDSTFDKDGYPTEDTLRVITEWPDDLVGWLDFCSDAWNTDYGKWVVKDDIIEVVTGGWSGNEDIVQAMSTNHLLWLRCWESQHRGGKWTFKLPRVAA